MNANQVTTGKVTFSYPHLFEPYSPQPGAKAKYSVCVLIPKTDKDSIKAINAAVEAAKELGKSKWGGKIPAKVTLPLNDGDDKEDETYHGHYYINCKNDRQPVVVDRLRQPITDPAEIYGGCIGRVSITFFAYDAPGNKGIGASLGPVQKIADGEPLGGSVGISVNEAFGDELEDDEDGLLD